VTLVRCRNVNGERGG